LRAGAKTYSSFKNQRSFHGSLHLCYRLPAQKYTLNAGLLIARNSRIVLRTGGLVEYAKHFPEKA